MARLEWNLKMGFYPTPEHTLSFILNWIAFQRPAGTQGQSHTGPLLRDRRSIAAVSYRKPSHHHL